MGAGPDAATWGPLEAAAADLLLCTAHITVAASVNAKRAL